VQGPAAFSRSCILTIKAGQSTGKKTGITLTPASFVLATIQGNVAGVHVQGVTLVTGSPGSFTIHLNKTVSTCTKVAWFAVNSQGIPSLEGALARRAQARSPTTQ